MITAQPSVAPTPSVSLAVGAPMPSLAEALATVPEPRGRNGLQHPLLPMLMAVVYAILCQAQNPAAVAGWVADHYDDWLRDEVGFTRPRRPCRTTFHLFLRRLDWMALERALCGWISAVAAAQGLDLDRETLALDGKEVRGVRQMCQEALVLISAFTHQSGLTLAIRSCGEGQEQAAVRSLLREVSLRGRVVTADALHTQRETTQTILDGGGDYVFTVKGNQPGLAQAVSTLFEPDQREGQDRERTETSERAHGRLEGRSLAAVSVTEAELGWPGVAQAFCLTRTVRRRRNGKTSFEVVWGITSLTREEAGPDRLLRLNRGHWEIENRNHWIRDVAWREDAGLAFLDNTAEVLATIRTTVLSLFSLHGVRNVAAQLRQNANRPRDAGRFLGLAAPNPLL